MNRAHNVRHFWVVRTFYLYVLSTFSATTMPPQSDLAAKDIEAGRVVEPFELVLPLGSSFYLVYPEAHSLRPNIAAFRDWLVQEIRES